MTAQEEFRSFSKWTEPVSCGEMAAIFMSVQAYYALSPATEDITRMSYKRESCDELPNAVTSGVLPEGIW